MKVLKRNPELRRVYMMEQEHTGCELFHHLDGDGWDQIRNAHGNPKWGRLSLQCHHIYGGPRRWDVIPNIIAVSQPAHDYCHKFPNNGRIACLWVKCRKGEFDRELMRTVCGFDVIGRIDSYVITEEWVWQMRLDILEKVSQCG